MIETPAGFVRSPDGTRIGWFRTTLGSPAPNGPVHVAAPRRPALILVHGATADHTAFRVVGPRLAEHRTVIAIDRRGRGASGDQQPYAIEREYEDLVAVVDWLAAETGEAVDVVGHSFGGRIGLGAARRTTNLRRLVVYEGAPAPQGRAFQDDALLARLDGLEAKGDLDGLLATFLTEVVGLPAADLEAYRHAPTWPIRAAAAPTAIRELRAEAGRDAGIERLADIRIPVLQLVGGASPEVFTVGTNELDRLLANGRIVVLARQRHAAHHTDPEAFVAAIEGFLDDGGTIAP